MLASILRKFGISILWTVAGISVRYRPDAKEIRWEEASVPLASRETTFRTCAVTLTNPGEMASQSCQSHWSGFNDVIKGRYVRAYSSGDFHVEFHASINCDRIVISSIGCHIDKSGS